MTRRRRSFLPGATYHAILRGNNAQPIFLSDEERCRFCLLMQEGVERFGHEIVAFCLMSNHVHIAIKLGEQSLSHIFHNLAGRYCRYFNRRHKMVGHLFQGRFRSVLVDSQGYMRELIRYIHLNPVRAQLVKSPQDYRWSSHSAYLGRERFMWLSPEIGLRPFGRSDADEVDCFHRFVLAGIGVEEGIDFDRGNADGVLGDSGFVKEMNQALKNDANGREISLEALLRAVSQKYGISLDGLASQGGDRQATHARAVMSYLARESQTVTLEELARFLGRSANTLSKAAARFEARLRASHELRKEVESLGELLDQV